MGGIAATYFHEELIQYDCVDYVLRGDSTERPFGALMDALARGNGDLAAVPNLIWKDAAGAVRVNPLAHVEATLDDFTNDYLRMFRAGIRYADIRNMIPFHDWWSYPITAVMTCRGCTQNCVICGGSKAGYAGYAGRRAIAFRSPEKLVTDVRRIARYTHAPIFLIGDLRQGGEAYARRVLDLLTPHRIPNYMVLELFAGASEAWMDAVAKAFANFNFEMSPETHDEEIRARGGKPYTNREIEDAIRMALDRGARKFDLYFMTGLPGQSVSSVMDTIDWCGELMARFDKRLALFISPLAPFLDPGSIAYENAEAYGVKILYRGLEAHRRALTEPSWKYALNYETDAMTRDEIVQATYEAARRLNRLKGQHGHVSADDARRIDDRIARAMDVVGEVDRIVAALPPGAERDRALAALRTRVDAASVSTVCDTEEIKWPLVAARTFRFPALARDILFGPKIR
jgi:B12-binding domain/radical SAM domain protein